MFNGEALAVKNPELIYATPLNNNIISIAFPLKLGGWNGLGITQKLIDAYYMKDGEDYVQQPDYYEEAGTVPTIATGYEPETNRCQNVSGPRTAFLRIYRIL
ncbi:hypothetical protein NXY15_01210 [Bacteroides thetaiotaomicron]|nr:hypothetical protein NXY15_01210 [Bacteroides thetaiotaomicron]